MAWALWVSVLVGLLILVPQGLDATDMGFWLTAYERFRIQPESMGMMAASWLSVLIGHGVALLSGGAVVAYKIAAAVLSASTAVLAWRTLAPRPMAGTDRLQRVLLATAIGVVAFNARSVHGNWIGYNDIGAFLHLLGASLLLKGLLDKQASALVWAGVVLGLNTYARLPNVTGIALVAAVWLHGALQGQRAGLMLGRAARVITGWAVGLCLGAAAITVFGHDRFYLAQLHAVFELARSPNSTHAGSGLLRQFVIEHGAALREGVIVLATAGAAAWTVASRHVALRALMTAAMAVALYLYINRYGHANLAVPGAVGAVLLALILTTGRRDPDLTVLGAVAGALILLVPLGSNTGIAKANQGLWLALPLAISWLYNLSSTRLTAQGNNRSTHPTRLATLHLDAPLFRMMAAAGVLGIGLHAAERAVRHTYLDSTDRRSMTHSIAHPKLIGTLTTAARAQALSELLAAMPGCARPGEVLLAYNAIPLLHILTDTRPWLDDSWPDLMISPDTLAQRLDARARRDGRLPCIVRARVSTYDRDWPTPPKPPVDWWRQDENRKHFAAFDALHGYRVTWSSDSFEILQAR